MPTFEEITREIERKEREGDAPGRTIDPWEARTLESLSAAFRAQDKAHEEGTAAAPTARAVAARGWSLPAHILDAAALGSGPDIAAKFPPAQLQQLGLPVAAVPSMEPSAGGKIPSVEGAQREAILGAREAWRGENPGKDILGTGIGAAPWAFGGAVPGARLAMALPERLPSWIRSAVSGMGQGAGSSLATSPLSDAPLPEQVATGTAFGGLVNPLAQGARGVLGLTSHITPGEAASARGLVESVGPGALRPGQMPGAAPGLRLVDRLFGKGSNPEQRAMAQEKLTEAAGLPSREVGQGWVQANDRRVGKIMDDIQQAHDFHPDATLVSDINSFLASAKASLPTKSYEQVYEAVKRVATDLKPGGTPGTIYHGWMKRGGTLHNFAESKDPGVADKVNEFKHKVMEPAWERSIPPEAFSAWQTAKGQYRLTRRIDDSLDATSHTLDFKRFLGQVEKEYGSTLNAPKATGDIAVGGPLVQRGERESTGHFLHSPWTKAATTAGGAFVLGSYFHDPVSRAWDTLLTNPSEIIGPVAAGAAAAYGGGRMANRLFNSPSALNRMIAAGERAGASGLPGGSPKLFYGVNPLTFGSQFTAPEPLRRVVRDGLEYWGPAEEGR